ncbi:MAG TPA: nucleoside triphosphate pyrophosphohydrolase [Candidatus Acidoferrales bacterium]|nr:nucleoside triphosphate pyrophosphohydrolase [Candidatus Acidoferrales bacterium]
MRRSGRRSAGSLFEALVALQARLRAPHGCPWDREQTHQTLRTYLIEEAYEVLEALDSGDDRKFASELGDLLLQIVFHAQLAREDGRFDISDVIEAIHSKMVRRHPHVFGKVRTHTSADVLKNWEQLKAEERREEATPSQTRAQSLAQNSSTSLLDGVPRTLPAVLEAYQLTRRASRIGFDWDNFAGLVEKLAEETAELREAAKSADAHRQEEEAGDLLFVAVNVARYLGVDPEIALKRANAKFAARFRAMEEAAGRTGRALADVPRTEMEALWDAAKRTPVSNPDLRAAGAARTRS